jgi:hypothetical protein
MLRSRSTIQCPASVVRCLAIAAAVSWLSACAFVAGSHQKVRVSTNVPAKIYVENRLLAETNGKPATARLRRGADYVLTARAEGYEDTSTSLKRRITFLGTLDLIGGIFIVLPAVTFATGHAYSVEPNRIHLDLEKARP